MGLGTTLLASAIGWWHDLPDLNAQEMVGIDLAAGRVVLEDTDRAISTEYAIIDPAGGILYVWDREVPEGVMGFSLHTGEHVRTIAAPQGEGPEELPQGMFKFASAPDGGLYVAGLDRLLEFDALGEVVNHWRPQAPQSKALCAFGNVPAVPTWRGVVRRGLDGADESIGPHALRGRALPASTREEAHDMSDRIFRARIACTQEAAYVVMSNDEGPDSVYVYDAEGAKETRFAVPKGPSHLLSRFCTVNSQIRGREPCPEWHRGVSPSVDEARDDLVLLNGGPLVAPDGVVGVVVDPETKCHAFVRPGLDKQAWYARRDWEVMRIHQDSALVYHLATDVDHDTGRERLRTHAFQVSLHPLRRLEGEPCPGMLPSVG